MQTFISDTIKQYDSEDMLVKEHHITSRTVATVYAGIIAERYDIPEEFKSKIEDVLWSEDLITDAVYKDIKYEVEKYVIENDIDE